jgi:3-methylcrotonyl-CoA carboxylase alpha subunit
VGAYTAAEAASYVNAGTVEFLVETRSEGAERFYFLEVNARLQVEHGVTEQVLGVDLVHAQLTVASGDPLPWRQEALMQRGHAIEVRIYAEDPAQQFLPQAGRLLLYREPRLPGVRIDSGVSEGDEVPRHYDPLVAKVIAAAETRPAAIDRLIAALQAFPVLGIRTNLPFLLRILQHDQFRAGTVDVGFVDRELSALVQDTTPDIPPYVAAAIREHSRMSTGTGGSPRKIRAQWDPWDRLSSWRLG